MATSIVALNALVIAGTVGNAPVATINVGNDPVTGIRWRVPPGPRGHLEFWVGQSGVPVFPNTLGAGVIADDEWDTWTLDNPPSNPEWQVFAVNTGTLNHVIEFQFYCDSGAGGGGGTSVVDLTIFPQNDADIPSMFL